MIEMMSVCHITVKGAVCRCLATSGGEMKHYMNAVCLIYGKFCSEEVVHLCD